MVFRRRKIADRVQTLMDEVLHMLQKDTIHGFENCQPKIVQAMRLEERVLMSASPVAMIAEATTAVMESSASLLDGLGDEGFSDEANGENQESLIQVGNEPTSTESASALDSDQGAVDKYVSDATISDPEITTESQGLEHILSLLANGNGAEVEQTETGSDAAQGPELVVIDYRVQDSDTVLESLLTDGRDVRLLRLTGDDDGLTQITNKLEQIGNVSAIHLLTHGSDGEILLGATVLNTSTLAQHAPELLAWQHSLTADADILLYGCDVAETTSGKDFVDSLAVLTQTDVAASTDETGNTSLGGNWNLEYAEGAVEATIAFRTSVAQDWNGLLSITLADTNEFAVNTTATGTQNTSAETRGSQQAVSLAADGSYVVVWSSLNQDGSGWGVYARRFDSTGTALTGEILVSQTTSGDQEWARVVSADDGSFVVTWTGGATGSEDVYFQRFAANGTAVGGEVLANDSTTGTQKNSVIAMDQTTNEFVIAWQGEGPGDTSSIFFRRFNSIGTALDATDQLVNTAGANSEQDPAIAMQTGGGFVIAYERGNSNKVYFQRFNGGGEKVGSETQIDNVLSTSFGISIASDAAGNFTVAYREQGLLTGIWTRSFNADGTESQTWSHIATGDAASSSISMLNDGSYIVTWQKSSDGDGFGIYAQRFNSDSSSNGAAFLVNQTTAGVQSQPSVAAFDSNSFVVVWSGEGPGDAEGVFARQFNLSTPVLDLDADNSSGAIGSNFQTAYTDGGGAVAVVDSDATLTNVDSTNLTSLTVTITDRQDGNNEILAATTAGTSITATYTNGSLTLTGSDTVANYQQVLRSVTYNNLQNPGTGTSRTITFSASDGVNITQVATTTLSLNAAVNHAPVITSNGGGSTATVSVAENTTTVTTVTATDIDLPAQTLTYSITGGADAGKFQIDSATGVLSFIAAPNFESATDIGTNNVYDVVVEVTDGALTDSQSIAVTVTNVLEPPVANSDSFSGNANGTITGNVLTNDTNPDGGALVVLDHTAPSSGTASVSTSGALTYTPNTNFTGTDSLGYVISNETNGPEHYWNLAGQAVDSVGGANGTVTGTTTVSGYYGDALSFAGSSAVATLPDISYSNNMTLSFWFNVADNSGTGYQYIYSHGTASTQNSLNVFLINSSTPAVTANDVLRTRILDSNDADNVNGLDVDLIGLGLVDGNWHQYTLTTETGVGSSVYIDGVLRASITNGGDALNPAGSVFLGQRNDLDPTRDYHGKLDSVQIFNTTMTGSQAAGLYSSNGVSANISLTVTGSSTTLTPVADTHISKNSNSDNFGASTSLIVNKAGGSIGNDRALLRFDLSSIPSNATITGATLKLNATSNSGAFNINVYELTQTWQEGTEAGGSNDVASWDERLNGVSWTNAGGTFNSTVVSTLNTAATGIHFWDIRTLVQAWTNGSKVNNGLILGSPDGGAQSVIYDSREGTTPPVLEITYTVPQSAPTAVPDGPWTISEGDLLTLNGSDSTDPNSDLLTYEWDLNYNGTFNADATGVNPTLNWAALQAAGINDSGTYQIALRVHDGGNYSTIVQQALTVSNVAPTLNVTGATTAISGAAYTLNLNTTDPGNDTITSWTINWGDGTIQTVNGSPGSVTHVYTNSGFTNNIVVSATDEDGTYTPSDLYVTSFNTNQLFLFDGQTGAKLATSGSSLNPVDVLPGPDGLLYVTQFGSNDIDRYDPATGLFVDTFVYGRSGGLQEPARMLFGADGNIYVCSQGTGQILKFSGSDGRSLGVFIDSGSGGLTQPNGMTFGPDGNLYVGSLADGAIRKYDGETGNFLSTFASFGTATNIDLRFGPNGNLFASSTALNVVREFDAVTGAVVGDLISAGSGGMTAAAGFTWAPDGSLMVSDFGTDRILHFTSSGTFIGEFAGTSAGLDQPIELIYTPSLQVKVNAPPIAGSDSFSLSEGGSLNVATIGNWFNSNWGARTEINFNNTAQGSNLNDFQVLVKLHATATDAVNIDYSKTLNAGEDLRFVDAGGNVLAHEVESWNESGYSYVWVRVPVISSGTTGSMYLYYDNPNAGDGSNAPAVWDSNDIAVLHFNGNTTDSTSASNDGSLIDVFDNPGIAGGAGLFNGSTSSINMGSAAAVDDIFVGGGTISAWINPAGWGEGGYGRIADKAVTTFGPGGNGDGWAWQVGGSGSSGYLLFEQGFTGGISEWRTPTGSINLNTWQQVVIVYDSSSASNTPQFYINGVLQTLITNSTGSGTARSDAALDLIIGNHAGIRTFDGRIDEVRLTDGRISASEIAAQYRTIAGTPLSQGATQNGSGGLLENDSDFDSDNLTVSLVSGPAHAAAGSFVLNPDGSFTYTHDGSETTTDSFTYAISDGLSTRQATVSLNVTLVNDNAPQISSNGGGPTAAITIVENSTDITTVSATDADISSAPIIYSISGGADAARFSINSSTGQLQFITAPDADALADSGSDNVYDIIVQVSDGTFVDTQTISVTVSQLNDNSPVITSNGGGATATISVPENSTAVTTVIATDPDTPSSALIYSISGGASAASFSINSTTGVLRFLAAPSFEAPEDNDADNVYSVRVNVSDGINTTSQLILVTVQDVNEVPVASGDAFSLQEDTTLIVPVAGVLANDSDIDGDTLTAILVDDVRHGALILSSDGRFSYTPDADFNGLDTFTYRSYDGNLMSNLVTVSISVSAVNDAPVINLTSGTVVYNEQNAAIAIDPGLTVRDIDSGTLIGARVTIAGPSGSNADQLVFTAVSGITGVYDSASQVLTLTGTASVAAYETVLRSVQFQNLSDTPDESVRTVMIQVSDGSTNSFASRDLRVIAVNDAPVITSDGGVSSAQIRVMENTTFVTTVTSSDVDSETATYSIAGGIDEDFFTIDAVTGELHFLTPPDFDSPADADRNNAYVVRIRVTDEHGGRVSQTLVVKVMNVNEAPISIAMADVLMQEDAAPFAVDVSPSIVDPDGEALEYEIESITTTTAMASLFDSVSINAATGVITFDTTANAFGSAVVVVTGTDRAGLSSTAQFTIAVEAVNDAPVVKPLSGSTISGQSLSISSSKLLQGASDVEGDVIQAVVVQAPANGTVTVKADGSFLYQPNVGYFGTDTFLFAGTDGMTVGTAVAATIDVQPPFAIQASSTSSSNSTSTTNSTGTSANTTNSTTAHSTATSQTNGAQTTAAQATNSAGASVSDSVSGANASGPVGVDSNLNTAPVAQDDDNDDEIVGLLPQNKTAAENRLNGNTSGSESASASSSDREAARRHLVAEAFGRARNLMTTDWDTRSALTPLELQRQQIYRELAANSQEQINFFEEKLTKNVAMNGRVVGSVGVVTTGFSVGYLIWAVRGGMLLSGVLSQIPAWTMLDPLMVIDGDNKDDDKESLQTIMDRQQEKLSSGSRSTPSPVNDSTTKT